MSDNFLKSQKAPSTASDHVQRGDHLSTARLLIERLGPGALACVIGRQAEARALRNRGAVDFWDRVCTAVIQLRRGDEHELEETQRALAQGD